MTRPPDSDKMLWTPPVPSVTEQRDPVHVVVNRSLTTVALLLGIVLMTVVLWYGFQLQQKLSTLGNPPPDFGGAHVENIPCDVNAEGNVVCE